MTDHWRHSRRKQPSAVSVRVLSPPALCSLLPCAFLYYNTIKIQTHFDTTTVWLICQNSLWRFSLSSRCARPFFCQGKVGGPAGSDANWKRNRGPLWCHTGKGCFPFGLVFDLPSPSSFLSSSNKWSGRSNKASLFGRKLFLFVFVWEAANRGLHGLFSSDLWICLGN